MEGFELASSLTNVLESLKTLNDCPILSVEYDEFDGSIGLVVKDKEKVERFVIEVKEV